MADGHDDHGGGHGGGGGHGDSHGSGGAKGGKGGSNPLVSGLGAIVIGVAFVVVLISTIIHAFEPSTGVIYAPVDMKERIASQCDGLIREIEIGSDPVVFNPGALCSVNFDVKGGPIELSGPVGSATLQPGEQRDLPDLWPETARAVDGHAVLSYQLVQP